MSDTHRLRGLTTMRFHASDLEGATQWYRRLLGIDPYHRRSEYVEFRIGDYSHELGILDSRYAPSPGSVVTYWHVDDLAAARDRLLALGAREYEPPRDYGRGFIGASVIDPFGNILGIMQNPHYLEVLKARGVAGEPESTIR
ncbi:MAG: VOC family protein [Spirochaetes bacterium]|nr:VOC family protein [Spirochaetota bacterium]